MIGCSFLVFSLAKQWQVMIDYEERLWKRLN